MEIKVLKDKILLREKNDVLRLFLYGKLLEKGIRPLENDINILLELYQFGGFYNKEQRNQFIQNCLHKAYRRSAQSVSNTLSTYTKLNVLKKPKNSKRFLNEEYLPTVDCDKLVLQSLISHSN